MSSEGEQEIDVKLLMNSVNEQLKRLQVRLDEFQSTLSSINPRRHEVDVEEEDEDFPYYEQHNNDLANITMEIPAFEGKNDPELYFRWESKVERIFGCHNFSEEMKVKLAVVGFSDYASIWWDLLEMNRRRDCKRTIRNWHAMKTVMRERFIPRNYYRDLYRKLRELEQGFMSVEEYYQEMETLIFRARIKDDKEASMARFINGLNPEISDILDLQDYKDTVELLHEALRIEKQLKS